MTASSIPDKDLADIRTVLNKLKIAWKTPENLLHYHTLAEHSLSVARKMVEIFTMADTPHALPDIVVGLWLQQLLKNAVEIVMFPDNPITSDEWNDLAKIWDDYMEAAKQQIFTGTRAIVQGSWGYRESHLAAWNLEFAENPTAAIIGPIASDSAHRTSIRFAKSMLMEYKHYVDHLSDTPQERANAWDSFAAKWCAPAIFNQIEQVRVTLSLENSRMQRLLSNHRTETPSPPEAANDIALSDTQKPILMAMLELKAFDGDSRKTTAEIVKVAFGSNAEPDSYKKPMAALVNMKLANSNKGRGAGCWLTVIGKQRAEKLEQNA